MSRRIAIVNPTTLLGKELCEGLGRIAGLRSLDVRLYSASEDDIGSVTEVGGEAAIVGRFSGLELEGTAAAFFCGEIAQDRPLLADLPAGTVAIVLGAGAGIDDGAIAVAGAGAPPPATARVWISPHPAVVGLARLLAALAPLGLREASATVVQPASFRGQAGIDELFEETRSILMFTGQPKPAVFGRQLAFNLLPSREDAERIEASLRTLFDGGAPEIRVQAIQGGMFHGTALGVDLRFDGHLTAREIARALTADPAFELAKHAGHLGPIDGSGAEKIQVGEIRVARASDGTGQAWIWAVLDNLTVGGALNALALAAPWLGP